MNVTTSHTSGELTGMFAASHDAAGITLEEIRHNYYIAAKMDDIDAPSIGGIRVNQSGRNDDATLSNDKEKQAVRDMLFLTLLNDLQALESNLEDKYGEDFAETLAAEHLDEETYRRIMEVEDQEERRRQIALELKRGIDNGTIDPNAIENPDFIEWIEKRTAIQELRADIELGTPVAAENKEGQLNHQANGDDNLSAGLSKLIS